MPETIRVIAREGARTPFRDELGRGEPGRYYGLDAAGQPRAEDVPDSIYVRRAIRRGDLEEAPPAPTPVTNPDALEGAPDAPAVTEAPPAPPQEP